MEWLEVVNWKKYQHYKNRCPPWIKLHTELLNDRKFSSLSCASKGLLMQLWILASENEGKVPADLAEIQFRLRDDHINYDQVNLLIQKGFLRDRKQALASASKCFSEGEAETEGETETETEKPLTAQRDLIRSVAPAKSNGSGRGGPDLAFDPVAEVQKSCRASLGFVPAIGKAEKWTRRLMEQDADLAELIPRFFRAVSRASPEKPQAFIHTVIDGAAQFVQEESRAGPSGIDAYVSEASADPVVIDDQELEAMLPVAREVETQLGELSDRQRILARMKIRPKVCKRHGVRDDPVVYQAALEAIQEREAVT